MPTAKKRKAPTTRTWDEACRAAIASGGAEAIGAIQFKLGELTGAARARALDLKVPQAVEEWVTLVRSSEDDKNLMSRTSRAVRATFAAGPAGLEFYINSSC
jgi:hypothetical protein